MSVWRIVHLDVNYVFVTEILAISVAEINHLITIIWKLDHSLMSDPLSNPMILHIVTLWNYNGEKDAVFFFFACVKAAEINSSSNKFFLKPEGFTKIGWMQKIQ